MAANTQDINRTRAWRRSSRCTPGKNCVEVGRDDAGVIIRDSKCDATLPAVNDLRWAMFLTHCQAIATSAIKS